MTAALLPKKGIIHGSLGGTAITKIDFVGLHYDFYCDINLMEIDILFLGGRTGPMEL